jgi:hypothetical protein
VVRLEGPVKASKLTVLAVIIVGLASAEWIDFGTGVSEARGGNAG